jgi:hypothetical protein
MTHETVPPADDPRVLLQAVRDVTRQVRIAQRGAWFSLLVFGVVTLAVIPVYRYAPHELGRCRSGPQPGTYFCTATIPGVLVYWPVALVLGYAVIAGFYARRSRQRGVGTPVGPYVIAGVAALLLAASLWRALSRPPLPIGQIDITPLTVIGYGLASPPGVIGLALLVLAWVERNRALLAFSLIYLVVAVADSVRITHSSSPWFFLPQLLIPAALLLVGSAGFAMFQRATVQRATVQPDTGAGPQ